MTYDLNDIFVAFRNLGQDVVSLDMVDRFAVTEEELLPACTEVTFDQVVAELLLVKELRLLDEVRATRNALLAKTDHWAYQDTPDMTAVQSAYRQALRDITGTYTSLEDVVWPINPLETST